ncbi:N(G),N(G)-dimethylarginine dimethylaminohydrolase [bacterium BMS3Abin03]|nr:N(G),N(G)-dimethylarginine dimethylaminohydrolase [bacterium BMS3Abin03]MCG6960562.1 N(G),N(G)-dimethylarginine dimethylaminohydrolase [bacterium BMS3Abin03]
MFTKAIVKRPCKNLVNGLTTANLGKPDYDLALKQHQGYIEALIECGLEVTILEADEDYPDSVFVEDTAILTPRCAIITNPGAPSRRGEIIEISKVLKNIYQNVETITEPGTLEAGDVMMVGNHFYIGISKRTNQAGANQLINILEKYDLTGSTITLENVLHLKSGVSYLDNNNLLSIKNFINEPEFQKYNIILVDEDESYAANSLWINDNVLVPEGFPKTKENINNAGYTAIEIDVTEFRKLDGGLSCLSLRVYNQL